MTPEDAFLEDIRDNPDDDAIRLIYADWLEDRGGVGDADRAEFIRVQIAAPSLRGVELVKCNQRADDLLKRHWEDWTAPLWRILGRKTHSSSAPVGFQRGFIHELTLGTAEFLAHRRALSRIGVIGKLRLLEAGGHGAALSACESLASMRDLEFADYYRAPFTAPDMMALANSPYLDRLRVLRLARNNLGDAGVYALAGAAWLSGVVALDLTDNGLSRDGVVALASTRHPFRPLWLRLARNPIGASVATQMAGLDLITQLVTLDDPDALSGILRPASADILTEVMGLDLSHCNLDNYDIVYLASIALESLRDLDLTGNEFDDEGIRSIVRAPWTRGLRRLAVRGNPLTHAGLGLLAPLLSRMNVEF